MFSVSKTLIGFAALVISTSVHARGDEDFPFACQINDAHDATFHVDRDSFDYLHEVRVVRGLQVITNIPATTSVTTDEHYRRYSGERTDGLVTYYFDAYVARDDSGVAWIRYGHRMVGMEGIGDHLRNSNLRRATCIRTDR